MENLHNLSDELKVYCYFNGVKLIRPDKSHQAQHSAFFYDTGYTVSSILILPLSVTILDLNANTITINDFSATTSGWLSKKDAIGKSILDIATADCGRVIMQHNREVMDSSQKMIVEESIVRKNDTTAEVLAVKSPLYNEKNQVIGLFGCGLRLGVSPLADSLSLIAKIGLLNNKFEKPQSHYNQFPGKKINNNYFTKRQCEILRYLVRGKSAKTIAAILNLSQRTIETHLALIKTKLNVNSKSELIDKVFDNFASSFTNEKNHP